MAIFDGNRRLSRKSEIGRWLLWNVNKKSWVRDRMVSFSMTLSDPNPGFKVTVYLQGKYLKNGAY